MGKDGRANRHILFSGVMSYPDSPAISEIHFQEKVLPA